VVGTLAVVGPAYRFQGERIEKELAPLVVKAGRELSSRLGFDLGRRDVRASRLDDVPEPPDEVKGPARLLFGLALDPNRADAAALEALPGIGPARAAAIVAARCERPFAGAWDLERVPGIGPRTRAGVEPNPVYDADLRPHGVVCAACHVRGYRRFGPPRRDGSLASATPRPPHGGVTRTAAFLSTLAPVGVSETLGEGGRVIQHLRVR